MGRSGPLFHGRRGQRMRHPRRNAGLWHVHTSGRQHKAQEDIWLVSGLQDQRSPPAPPPRPRARGQAVGRVKLYGPRGPASQCPPPPPQCHVGAPAGPPQRRACGAFGVRTQWSGGGHWVRGRGGVYIQHSDGPGVWIGGGGGTQNIPPSKSARLHHNAIKTHGRWRPSEGGGQWQGFVFTGRHMAGDEGWRAMEGRAPWQRSGGGAAGGRRQGLVLEGTGREEGRALRGSGSHSRHAAHCPKGVLRGRAGRTARDRLQSPDFDSLTSLNPLGPGGTDGLFWDQKWVKNGSKTHFSKPHPRPFGVHKWVK